MAITSFIPEVWHAALLEQFSETAVAASLVSREFEGTAARGNVVKVNTAQSVTISDYADAGRQTSPQVVTTVSQDLLIDQERAWDFLVDDIDRAQAAGSLEAFTRSAATGLAEDADQFILATAVAGADSGNVLPETSLSTGDAAFNVIRDLRKALNKAHVPQADRALIINAEFESLLLGADAKFTSVDTSGSPEGLRNAALGRILGAPCYVTENMPVTDRPQALMMYRPSVAYVSQLDRMEALRDQNSFSDRLRGLHVYGAKVVRPTGLAVFTAQETGSGGGEDS